MINDDNDSVVCVGGSALSPSVSLTTRFIDASCGGCVQKCSAATCLVLYGSCGLTEWDEVEIACV